MALTLGWFAVSVGKADADSVRSKLRESANALGPAKTPEWAFLAASGSWTAILLSADGRGFVDEWASQMSSRLKTAALSFWVFEGSWSWKLFNGDGVAAAMDAHGSEVPALSGDLGVASRLLGMTEETIRRYATAEVEASFRAAPGDTLPPWDEWAHVNFAQRAGIEYPEVDDDERFFFREEDRPQFKRGKRRKPSFEPGTFAVFEPFGVVEIRERQADGTFRYVALSVDETLRYGDPHDARWRQLVTPSEAQDLLRILKKPLQQLKERRERRRQTDEAVASGNPTAVAVALNELLEARRQGSLRDPFEHSQLDALRDRLVRELARATGRTEDDLKAELS